MTLTLTKSIHLRRAPSGGLQAYKGGQFIDSALWQGEREKASNALPGLLKEFSDRTQFLRSVYEQNAALKREHVTQVKLVPLSTVESQMKSAIRDAYSKAFLLGKKSAGNLTSATAEELEQVKRLRLDEYAYLRGFLSDIRSESGRMPYEQRTEMYVSAARELYWLGYVLGNKAKNRRLIWKLGNTEKSCQQCPALARHGEYTVSEFMKDVFPRLPQSGRLPCMTNCGCRLEERIV